MKLDMRTAIEAVHGRVRDAVPALPVAGVSTDSRTVAAGELFFAIAGENFDGHRFVAEVWKRGAVGAVIQAARADAVRHTLAEAQTATREGIPATVGARKDSRTSDLARTSDPSRVGEKAGGENSGVPLLCEQCRTPEVPLGPKDTAHRAVAHGESMAHGESCVGDAFVLIEVDDTIAALGRLAAQHRRSLRGRVIAVVGSNGKTTTKALLDHLLAARFKGRCSPKSFNNNIGVPLTLFSAAPADDYVVVEIGTNAPGEVAALARIARPDLAVVTAIGEEHLEGLKDLNGVAAEECSVLREMRPGGFAAVNIDAPEILAHLPMDGPAFITFGRSPNAQIRVTDVRYEAPWLRFEVEEVGAAAPHETGWHGHLARGDRQTTGKMPVPQGPYRVPLLGPHNAINAAGAIAIARKMGLTPAEIAARLESFTPPPMRMETQRLGDVTLINDAYNANPHSALAAVETLEALPCAGRRILVFGEMRELGEHAAALHRKVAERFYEGVANGRLDCVLLVGVAAELMYETLRPALRDTAHAAPRVERFETVEQCAARLAENLAGGDTVLLKASRAVGLERCAELLRQRRAAAQAV